MTDRGIFMTILRFEGSQENLDLILQAFLKKGEDCPLARVSKLSRQERIGFVEEAFLSLAAECGPLSEDRERRGWYYLYILVRFVEQNRRFPKKHEQGLLLESFASGLLGKPYTGQPGDQRALELLKEQAQSYLHGGPSLPDKPGPLSGPKGGQDESYPDPEQSESAEEASNELEALLRKIR
jgi:hypothetical protein